MPAPTPAQDPNSDSPQMPAINRSTESERSLLLALAESFDGPANWDGLVAGVETGGIDLHLRLFALSKMRDCDRPEILNRLLGVMTSENWRTEYFDERWQGLEETFERELVSILQEKIDLIDGARLVTIWAEGAHLESERAANVISACENADVWRGVARALKDGKVESAQFWELVDPASGGEFPRAFENEVLLSRTLEPEVRAKVLEEFPRRLMLRNPQIGYLLQQAEEILTGKSRKII